MRDTLIRIKRAVLAGRYAFSEKARTEMEVDRLTESDVAESIINAVAIYNRLRSRSPLRSHRTVYLYVIQSTNFEGVMVYSKGKLITEGRGPVLLSRVLEEGVVMAQPKGPFYISACPTCGSTKIRAVQEDCSDSHAGKRYVVRKLRYFHCPQCGEKVYDPSAMRRIQAYSGNAISVEQFTSPPQIVTIPSKVFDPLPKNPSHKGEIVKKKINGELFS